MAFTDFESWWYQEKATMPHNFDRGKQNSGVTSIDSRAASFELLDTKYGMASTILKHQNSF